MADDRWGRVVIKVSADIDTDRRVSYRHEARDGTMGIALAAAMEAVCEHQAAEVLAEALRWVIEADDGSRSAEVDAAEDRLHGAIVSYEAAVAEWRGPEAPEEPHHA